MLLLIGLALFTARPFLFVYADDSVLDNYNIKLCVHIAVDNCQKEWPYKCSIFLARL